MKQTKSGFTLVELLIVIIVIAILSTIMLVVYNGVQARARDAKRQQDLHAIGEAIQLYRQKYGNDVQVGSGCGSNGNGSGYFNYQGSGYPKSVLSCLTDAGYLNGGGNFVDPTGCTTYTGSSAGSPLGYCHKVDDHGSAYMKYSVGSGDDSYTCLYARLETKDDSETLKSSSNPCYSANSAVYANNFGMNYELLVK